MRERSGDGGQIRLGAGSLASKSPAEGKDRAVATRELGNEEPIGVVPGLKREEGLTDEPPPQAEQLRDKWMNALHSPPSVRAGSLWLAHKRNYVVIALFRSQRQNYAKSQTQRVKLQEKDCQKSCSCLTVFLENGLLIKQSRRLHAKRRDTNSDSFVMADVILEPIPQASGPGLIKVSKAAADLMAYCEAHAKEDPLLTPVPASENPFREKKFFCAIL
ncbi:Guanine nucleotide-binding protein G(I)/G(S)/G(O) subunit gamma-2, partial [Ophiophagus hannah]